ncbi:MAG: hypothetical protein AUH85_07710 [Chloroflexi bacterium 13_1_40CM_4_68_4]|nr:MAG: hypothetical protein AUH85_07710 [Chloroflexi bacterium 13_1_40CM_4_68_4]
MRTRDARATPTARSATTATTIASRIPSKKALRTSRVGSAASGLKPLERITAMSTAIESAMPATNTTRTPASP